MRSWGRLRTSFAELPPIVLDTALAVGMTGVTMWVGTEYELPGFRSFDALAFALTGLANIPLALRRRAPVAVLGLSCVALVWFIGGRYTPSFNIFGPLLALYTVAALRRPRVAVPAALVTGATLFYSCAAFGVYSVGTSLAQALVTTGVAWVFGTTARQLADRNRQLVDLADQLRREREERARAAVSEERMRIARELHDVVAHHMSVVSVQAGLARYVLPSDPDTAGTALHTVVEASHEALEEMRRLLSVLRVNGSDERPDGTFRDVTPGLARLGQMVERIRSAGVGVDLVITGPSRQLPPGADLCAYRIVQESLTNVLKHAPSAHVTVELRYEIANFSVRISDDGPGPTSGGPASDGPASNGQAVGHGLIGMRERARLYGGTVTTGPGPDGGFVVALTMPYGTVPDGQVTAHTTAAVNGTFLGQESVPAGG